MPHRRVAHGAPRVAAEMRLRLGRQVDRKRVDRLTGKAALQELTRRHGWRNTKFVTIVSAYNLVAGSFRPAGPGPDETWVADATQHPIRAGWILFSVVVDSYSRLMVGHTTADQPETEFVVDAFDVAN